MTKCSQYTQYTMNHSKHLLSIAGAGLLLLASGCATLHPHSGASDASGRAPEPKTLSEVLSQDLNSPKFRAGEDPSSKTVAVGESGEITVSGVS